MCHKKDPRGTRRIGTECVIWCVSEAVNFLKSLNLHAQKWHKNLHWSEFPANPGAATLLPAHALLSAVTWALGWLPHCRETGLSLVATLVIVFPLVNITTCSVIEFAVTSSEVA